MLTPEAFSTVGSKL